MTIELQSVLSHSPPAQCDGRTTWVAADKNTALSAQITVRGSDLPQRRRLLDRHRRGSNAGNRTMRRLGLSSPPQPQLGGSKIYTRRGRFNWMGTNHPCLTYLIGQKFHVKKPASKKPTAPAVPAQGLFVKRESRWEKRSPDRSSVAVVRILPNLQTLRAENSEALHRWSALIWNSVGRKVKAKYALENNSDSNN